jgi:hypothetical protein
MEIAKKISFVTTDTVTFERKEFFRTGSEKPQDTSQPVGFGDYPKAGNCPQCDA